MAGEGLAEVFAGVVVGRDAVAGVAVPGVAPFPVPPDTGVDEGTVVVGRLGTAGRVGNAGRGNAGRGTPSELAAELMTPVMVGRSAESPGELVVSTRKAACARPGVDVVGAE
jgi:hypothetical protein